MKACLPAFCMAAVATSPAMAAERNFSVTSFDRVRIDGPYKVEVKTGVPPFAVARGSGPSLDGVSLSVEGRTLIVRSNPGSWGGYPGQPRGPVTVAVGTHDLSQAWVNGSGTLVIDRIRGLSFDLALQGSGSATITNVDVDQMKIGISGAGSAAVAGKAAKLTAMVRGTSTLDASALATKDSVVGAEGPSDVRFLADATARVEARGASSVAVGGNPSCTVKAQGSAVVTGCD